MARTYEYAILTAIPDARRGERVNVGILVFHDDRIDVRFGEAAQKLRALTGDTMAARLEGAQWMFGRMFKEGQKPKELVKRFHGVEPMLVPSELGWFAVDRPTDYDQRIAEILESLVTVPKKPRAEHGSRFSTQIADDFREAEILAKKGEEISTGRVVRNFQIGKEVGVVADFAMKNGKLHILSALDMRKEQHGMLEAAFKSLVLDRAKATYKAKAKTLGVIILDPGTYDEFRPQIGLFEKYAEEPLFDWADPKARKRLRRHFQDAMDHPDAML